MSSINVASHLMPEDLVHIIKSVDMDDVYPVSISIEDNINTIAQILEDCGVDPKVENKRNEIMEFLGIEPDTSFTSLIKEIAMKTDRQKAIERLERQRSKIESELFKLYQEEKEWNERYKKANEDKYSWDNVENSVGGNETYGGQLQFYEDEVEQRMRMLYNEPFGTEIPFFKMSDADKERIGPKLKVWFDEVIMKYIDNKIMVAYVINNKVQRFRLHDEINRIKNMFSGNYLFNVEEMPSGIKSGDDTPFYISFIDNMWFEWIDERAEKPKGKRSVHNDGFFPRRLKGLYKYFAPILRKYQIYDTYLDNKVQEGDIVINNEVKEDCLVPCLIHSLRQAGIDEEVLDGILSFTGYQRVISRYVFTEIANAFNLRFHLRIYDHNGGCITIANKANRGWYGDEKNETKIYLAEYRDHIFLDEELPINLFAIKNFGKVHSYGIKHNWDIEKMFKVCRIKNGRPEIDTKKAHARSLDVIIAIDEAGGFEELKTTDKDVDRANIFLHHLTIPEPKPKTVKILETRLMKEKENEKVDAYGSVYYGDFETCKKKVEGIKNVSYEAVPFMLCIQDKDGKEAKTFVGKYCVEQALDYLPDKALVYFHNFGFDGNFFMKYGKGTVIKKGSKNMMMQVEYKHKKISFRDSYSMFSKALKQFPASFPEAFNETDIKKEVFPYDYYTYERIYMSSRIGKISDAIKEGHLSKEDGEQFKKNIKMTNSEVGDGFFDMIKYCDFYCTQDVNVLRVGFNAFRDAALQEPIKLDVFKFLTLPSLANAYMKRQVFHPNKHIYELAGNVQSYIQKCIYGGRCMTADNKRYIVKDKLDDFDACSLYPSAMNRMFCVEGIPEYYEHKSDEVYNKEHLPYILIHAMDEEQCEPTEDKYISQFFVTIKIINVGIKRKFPLIVKREPGKQTNCNECVEMNVDMITLQDLIRFQDISFTMSDGYIMKGRRDFTIRNEIKKLFELRAEFKKKKNPTQEIIKLIMNSAYGKTIQKAIKSYLTFVKKDEYEWFVKNRYHNIIRVDDVEESGHYLFELRKKLSRQFNNVVFGVSVLSMSKRIMNEVMCLAEDLGINIYYQDTDSMHIEHDKLPILAKEYKKRYDRELIGDNIMGCFHNDFDELKNAYATLHISLGKKMYYDRLENDDGKVAEHFRLKGIPQDTIRRTAKQLFGGSVEKLYLYLYEGNDLKFDLNDGRVSFKFLRSGQIQYIDNFNRNVKPTCEKYI